MSKNHVDDEQGHQDVKDMIKSIRDGKGACFIMQGKKEKDKEEKKKKKR